MVYSSLDDFLFFYGLPLVVFLFIAWIIGKIVEFIVWMIKTVRQTHCPVCGKKGEKIRETSTNKPGFGYIGKKVSVQYWCDKCDKVWTFNLHEGPRHPFDGYPNLRK